LKADIIYADAIWREEGARDSKAIDLWNVLLMAMAKDSKVDAVTCTSILICSYISKADAMVVDAFRRCAVAHDVTDAKDVVSLAA